MWVKVYKGGHVIGEDRSKNITWLKTPTDNIDEVFLVNNGIKSRVIKNCLEYWHSRSAVFDSNNNRMTEIAERIQGLIPNGDWFTVTWTGNDYIYSYEKKAIGKPVV